MPVLSVEPMLYPQSLLDNSQEGNWWVLHVRPRSEKALARACVSKHVSLFLPQYRCQCRGRRGKDSFLPLFPGYFFLFGTDRERVMALETNLTVNVLTVPNQRELFDDLQRIHRVIEADLAIQPGERLQPGTAAVIIDGPLSGLQGTVVRHKNKSVLMLKVSFLHQGAIVEIDSWMVEPMAAMNDGRFAAESLSDRGQFGRNRPSELAL